MSNFSSTLLERTFEKIFFSTGRLPNHTVKAATGNKAVAAKPHEKPALAGEVAETMGEEIEIIPGTDTGEFTSKSLNRTFENIRFSAGIKGAKPSKDLLPQSHPALLPQ